MTRWHLLAGILGALGALGGVLGVIWYYGDNYEAIDMDKLTPREVADLRRRGAL